MTSPEPDTRLDTPAPHEEHEPSKGHRLLKDPRFLVAASAGLLLLGETGRRLLLPRLRKLRLERSADEASDPLSRVLAGEIDDRMPDRELRIGIEGALQVEDAHFSDDERSDLLDLLETLRAKEKDALSSRRPSIRAIARRVVDKTPNVHAIASCLAQLRRLSRESEETSDELSARLSAGEASGTQQIHLVNEGIKRLSDGLHPEAQKEIREKLRQSGHRVQIPSRADNSTDWDRIDTIAQEKWPLPTLRLARHGIREDGPLVPEIVINTDGWLIYKSPTGKVLGYATYFPISRVDPFDPESPHYVDLTTFTLDDAIARMQPRLRHGTMLVTSVTQADESRTPDPTAALFFALQDYAHLTGAHNAIGASFSPFAKLRQINDIRRNRPVRPYRELWEADQWNTTVSAFSQVPDDVGFNDRFMDLTVPAQEVDELIHAEGRDPILYPRGRSTLVYLNRLHVPLEFDGEYHLRVPAGFKLLYDRETSFLSDPDLSIAERISMTLFAGRSKEPPRAKYT